MGEEWRNLTKAICPESFQDIVGVAQILSFQGYFLTLVRCERSATSQVVPRRLYEARAGSVVGLAGAGVFWLACQCMSEKALLQMP